ncbi:hypothetical protein LAZ67_20002055 [Cordylochernes scorpioides]|uniref:Uncharacterized protein n=1 Tax=Cordylochernes scorpioides TaxID=51811 RepID=A0ABY6LPC9_9ARAC|nr:hypothetical protein LAZ67_20002055 [Cordylochernes scorpioides]
MSLIDKRNATVNKDLYISQLHRVDELGSMSNHMRGTDFDDEGDLKTWLNNFFDTRPDDFWWNGINKLVERWEEVVNNNGEYIID